MWRDLPSQQTNDKPHVSHLVDPCQHIEVIVIGMTFSKEELGIWKVSYPVVSRGEKGSGQTWLDRVKTHVCTLELCSTLTRPV